MNFIKPPYLKYLLISIIVASILTIVKTSPSVLTHFHNNLSRAIDYIHGSATNVVITPKTITPLTKPNKNLLQPTFIYQLNKPENSFLIKYDILSGESGGINSGS